MSGEAVRKRNQRKGASAAAPPKIAPSKDTDVPDAKRGSNCCIKVLFFVLLSTAAVIASAVFTDYQNGQLREAYIQSVQADYRAAVDEAIIGFRKQSHSILEESYKKWNEAQHFVRATLKDIKYGDSNIDELIFGQDKDGAEAKKEAKLKMEEAAKLKAEKETKLKAEKEAKLIAEKEAKLKAEKESKLKAEKEAKLKAEKEAKLKAEQEAKLRAEKEAKLKAEKEAKLKAEQEAKLMAEKEAKLKAEQVAKLKAEQEAKLRAEKEAKLRAEREAKLKAEKEAKLKAEKEAKLEAEKEAKLKAEKEAKLKAEKDAKLKAEQEAKLMAEKEAKLRAEKEAKLKAEKEAKLRAEKEAKLEAEKEAKLKAEKEAKLKADKDAKLKEEREEKVKAEMEAKIKAEEEAKLRAEKDAKKKSSKQEKSKVSDPSEIRSKIQDKESSGQDDLELQRKLEKERLMRENLGNEKNTKSQKDRNEALEAAKKAAKLNDGRSNSQYTKRLVTNSEDALIMDLLDSADEVLDYDPQGALKKFEEIISEKSSTSPRAFYGKAMALKKIAELERSNPKLENAIDTFQTLLAMGDLVPDVLYRMAGEEVVRLLKFRGWNNKAIKTIKFLQRRFPEDISFSKEIGVLHLIMGQNKDARNVFEEIIQRHPNDGFSLVHLGFVRKVIAKSDHDLEAAVSFLKRGIATRAEGSLEGNFFFHLGDALSRLNRKKEADSVYQEGADLGIFKSFWQRSLYNVDNIKSKPFWTPAETKVGDDLEKIRLEWKKIREEVLKVKNGSEFVRESENLLDSGSWQQFEIYRQGRKVKKNCLLTPFTCSLFEHFPPARTNTRGQIKFSIMSDNTHVHAHCGPTNTRLRIHLPLVVPSAANSSNLKLRVTDKYTTWKEGELLIFDDSFDHEVWNNSGDERLVLIFDIWHPEITSEQAATLPPM